MYIMLAANPAWVDITRALGWRWGGYVTRQLVQEEEEVGGNLPVPSSQKVIVEEEGGLSQQRERQDTKGISHKLAYDLSPAKRVSLLSLFLLVRYIAPLARAAILPRVI